MRYRNKFNINFFHNPYKKDKSLLSEKNKLEADWYNSEADGYFAQLDTADNLIPMDKEYEEWFGAYYDKPEIKHTYDKCYNYFSSFPQTRPLKMLELGCGNGALSRFFIRRDIEVVSIDIAAKACQFLARSESRSTPLVACSEILPFKAGSFDIVTSYVALHHFNLNMSLAEMYRIIKPGGAAIFMEPTVNSELFYKLRQLIPIDDNESPGGGGLVKADLITALENTGFNFKIKEFELLTRLERLPGWHGLQRPLRKIDYTIFKALPFMKRFARVIVINMRKR